MLTATDLEISAGGQLLIQPVTFQIAPGDRIGLVGRNGAGKTTLARVLAGEGLPAAGTVRKSGEVAYLPQDPRTGDLDVVARDRILAARSLDKVIRDMRAAEERMGATGGEEREAAINRYARLEGRFQALGGYAAEAEAASIASSLGLPERVFLQPLGTLSGGQRRRVELARVLFSGAPTLLLDEPTNHLDADSILWLRGYLRAHEGGLVVISHDVDLLESTVNRVFHLDATRRILDVYKVGWKEYQLQRETDERRRHRERINADRKIVALRDRADRMRAKATKARMAHNLDRRAERIASGIEELRVADKVAKLRFPEPQPCGKTPLTGSGLSKWYGSLEVFTDVDLAIDRGSRVVVLGLNGAGKTTLLRILGGVDLPDTGSVDHGHGLKLGYYAQEHETLDADRSVYDNVRGVAPAACRMWRYGGFSGRSCLAGRRSTSWQARSRVGRRPGWPWRSWSSRPPTSCCSTSRPTTSTRRAGRRSCEPFAPTRGRSSSSPTTPAPSRRSTPSGSF
jgi:ATPase subunit of ABC transporter with duplicated ATPase domains